jgi:hypothetical protein
MRGPGPSGTAAVTVSCGQRNMGAGAEQGRRIEIAATGRDAGERPETCSVGSTQVSYQ